MDAVDKQQKWIEQVKSYHPDKKHIVEKKEDTICDVREKVTMPAVRITVTFDGYIPHTAYGAPL